VSISTRLNNNCLRKSCKTKKNPSFLAFPGTNFVYKDFLKKLLFKRVDIGTIPRVMIFSFQCWYWRCTKK
jgi:hypothetical protein